MKTQIFRFILYSIVAGLTCLNLTAASSPPSGENGVHFCGFTEQQSDTRRYARSLANLDVGEPRTIPNFRRITAQRTLLQNRRAVA